MTRRSVRTKPVHPQVPPHDPPSSERHAPSSITVKEECGDAKAAKSPKQKDVVAEAASKPRKRRRPDNDETVRPQPPKREARLRKQCPKAIVERMERVMSQRMFVVHRSGQDPSSDEISEKFNILGSTGNIYTVHMKTTPSCDCPDNLKGNAPCKHILFIFLKVLKVPISSRDWYQKALLPDELAQVYASAPTSHGAAASAAVQTAFKKASGGEEDPDGQAEDPLDTKPPQTEGELVDEDGPGGRRLATIGDDCPICFEEMSKVEFAKGELVFDVSMGGCGKPLHSVCFQMWSQSAKSRGSASTCVWCRAPWAAPAPERGKGKVAYTKSGYMNLASVAGMSGIRDTSTYYHHFVKGGKGKTWADIYAEGDELL